MLNKVAEDNEAVVARTLVEVDSTAGSAVEVAEVFVVSIASPRSMFKGTGK